MSAAQMRVSLDPADPAYDPTPRRVWCNDRECADWVTADEFRRVVTTSTKVLHGAVCIERVSKEHVEPVEAVPAEVPINAGFTSGFFVVEPKTSNVIEEATSPGDPDESVVVTQSERLPEIDFPQLTIDLSEDDEPL